ncbi:hypothetical protein KP509_03G081800 [Ceratopteris richardii]|nr:hypothetical protein KP509_03G081800 [Ceratopteris richardii]
MEIQQAGAEQTKHWIPLPTSPSTLTDSVSHSKNEGGHTLAPVDDTPVKARKSYTITKQRERWTESEHQKFLDALKLHGRAWRRIEEYIGTKTAVQIRSHAQKFFSKLEKEASLGGSSLTAGSKEFEIPPPRPKRKPSHPYPKKAFRTLSNSPSFEENSKSPPAVYSAFTPLESSSSATDSKSFLGKKNGLSAASVRLFGQTVVQRADESELDTEQMESTDSPRSLVSTGTEETSRVSPMSGYANADNHSHLVSDSNDSVLQETKSQLVNTISEWEKNIAVAHVPPFMGSHHFMHHFPAFWQSFMPPRFAYGTSDIGNTANAIAAATYAVASAWQAIQGALMTNANNNLNSGIIYNPIASLAASRKPVPFYAPTSAPAYQSSKEGCLECDCGDENAGTNLQGYDSTPDCCSTLTDSSRLSSYESNDERLPAKKLQRRLSDDKLPSHISSLPPESSKREGSLKMHTDPSKKDRFDNLEEGTVTICTHKRSTSGFVDGKVYYGQTLPDGMIPPENCPQKIAHRDQPLSFVTQVCFLFLARTR